MNGLKLGGSKKMALRSFMTNYNFVVSFVLLLIAAVAVNPSFLRWNNISNLFVQGTIVGIVAMGMSMIVSAGMIDISVGAQVALISGLGVLVLNQTGSVFVMLLFCCALGGLIGLFNGLLVAKGKMAPMIATLAMQSICRSIITQLGQGGPFTVSNENYESFRLIAASGFQLTEKVRLPYMMIIFCIVSFGFAVTMDRTKFGKHVYAVGSNETAAWLAGINVHRIKIAVFVITGLMSGVASLLYASRLTAIQASNAGLNFEMDAIAAVAIGGTAMSGGRGKIMGTFLGILMFRMINNILTMANVPPFLSGLVSGIIIIVAVLMQNFQNKKR
ncbi:ABC transporter permease [Oscillospiraceae bacterium MB08-C2-2]|nr:ABC transporter permease [Oscillospiraceae bacterium MB08-C2-2]